jgi:hypothetical protein
VLGNALEVGGVGKMTSLEYYYSYTVKNFLGFVLAIL